MVTSLNGRAAPLVRRLRARPRCRQPVLRIEASAPQFGDCIAADLKPIDAVSDNRLVARQFLRPISDRFGCTDLSLGSMSERFARSSAKQTSRTTMSSPLSNAPATLRLQWTAEPARQSTNAVLCHASVACGDALPMDVLHERIDVGCRLGAEIEMIGMLVHVESENWPARRRGSAHGRKPRYSPSGHGGPTRSSRTQPDPPANALPMAVNSACQRATEPKSRSSATAISPEGSPEPPRPSK